MKVTLSNAREALRIALKNGAVRFAEPHALEGLEDEGVEEVDVFDELHVALATGEVHKNERAAGRWIAFGVYLGVSFEVVRPGVVVVTVFEARER